MKIGIIICDRYGDCGGGKCFRSVRERAGAFSIYPEDAPLEVVGFGNCGGCPGGNIEYVVDEMKNNGAEAIHLATGFVVGYPPCPHLDYLKVFIEGYHDLPVVIGTHPIPQKYLDGHSDLPSLGTLERFPDLMTTRDIRKAYD
ncbi:CGGC domain-containing protein [Gemmatimonadota bacterium]